ncbi:hypothetical protein EKI60_06320 [Candidatus Saccharibacteria bacterium]|nr:MAG: hypothetical protein EKI60_06320 [Candidatus Saccharibacteria bacterium]
MSYLREDPEIEEVLSIERTGSGQFNVDVTRQLIQHEIEELTLNRVPTITCSTNIESSVTK